MLITAIEKMVNAYFAFLPRAKPRKEEIEKAVLIAHRGAHDNAKGIIENTDAAFALAQKVGCWGIEFDVRATADGVFIVNHDPDLNRLWGHDVVIEQLTFAQLRALEPGISSLNEVVVKYGKTMHLFIELKAPFHNEDALFNDLKGLEPGVDYHLLTLDPPIFSALTCFPKEFLLLVAGHNNVSELCNISLNEGYGGLLGSYLLLTNQKINLLKKAKQIYGVGFVDSKFNLYRELTRGIHWVFTNRADEVSRHLEFLKSQD